MSKVPTVEEEVCFSDQVRALIEECGITPTRVAIMAGITPSMMHSFLKCGKSLHMTTLDRIARVIGLRAVVQK